MRKIALWIAAVGGGVLVLAAARWLWPVLRWLFRHRAARVIEESRRRGIKLPAFKLTRRRAVIQRLTQDQEVIAAAENHARERGIPLALVMGRVERYAREIVPSFNPFLYFRIGIPLAGRITRALYDVRIVSNEGLGAVDRRQDGETSIVFAMNHRSNMDYVILAHLTADRAALSYAAGEWACVWPLGRLVGGMGAFFVRRGTGDDLYRRVLQRFVQMAVEGGLTQVIFPEGGLSRDGRLRDPKIGLLDYMMRGFDPNRTDILFVPVAVNYDWVLEDHSLLQPGGPEAGLRGWGGLFASTGISMFRNLLTARRAGSFRLGSASVSFGPPISTREYAAARGVRFQELEREERIEEVKKLARHLMRAIGEEIPPAAVPLLARSLLDADDESLSKGELIARARSLAGGEPLDFEAALRTLVLRKLVIVECDGCRVAPGGEEILTYYANAVAD